MSSGKRLLIAFLIMTVAITLTFAAGNQEPASGAGGDEQITLRFFSINPDRNAGQGAFEEQMLNAYLEAHPNVTLETEYLQDEPYKQKLRAYIASNNLPDVLMSWPAPAYLGPLLENDYLAPVVSGTDYPSEMNFLPGALDRYTYEGNIYGYAGNFDFFVLFYNRALFDEYGVKVPETYDELLAAVETFRANGISPVAGNGKDLWPASGMFGEIAIKNSKDQSILFDAIDTPNGFSKNPKIREAAELFKQLVDAGIFQDSFISADYGAAKNLFTQGKTAMWYIGSWEMSMKNDENLEAAFRDNLDVTYFPAVGAGSVTDLYGWNGRGYVISGDGENVEAAREMLDFIFQPDLWAKEAWQQGIYVPAQRYTDYFTGEENDVQLKISEMVGSATSSTGVFWTNFKTPAFKTDADQTCQAFAAGVYNVDEFLAELDRVSAKVSDSN